MKVLEEFSSGYYLDHLPAYISLTWAYIYGPPTYFIATCIILQPIKLTFVMLAINIIPSIAKQCVVVHSNFFAILHKKSSEP
jgi:hypothetical protein